MAKFAVVGSGAWGTALAAHAARLGHTVMLWALEPEVAVLQTLVEDALKQNIGEGHVADVTREAMSRMLLELGTLKEMPFEVGKSYYLDLTEAE